MKAIYKKPGESPEIIDIDNTLEALQKAVGGYIETLSICSDLCIVCNEEGLLKKMPYNFKLGGHSFLGPVLLVGVKGDEFTDVPGDPKEAMNFIFGRMTKR